MQGLGSLLLSVAAGDNVGRVRRDFSRWRVTMFEEVTARLLPVMAGDVGRRGHGQKFECSNSSLQQNLRPIKIIFGTSEI